MVDELQKMKFPLEVIQVRLRKRVALHILRRILLALVVLHQKHNRRGIRPNHLNVGILPELPRNFEMTPSSVDSQTIIGGVAVNVTACEKVDWPNFGCV
jgi:hypothetical protein